MRPFANREVKAAFDAFPDDVRDQLLRLRALIFNAAVDRSDIGTVNETLKWGGPSYVTKHGSTIRLGVPKNSLNTYALYFNCNSKLIDTFRVLYAGELKFEGNRAVVFAKGGPFREPIVQHCISLALQYHKIKHRPLLGA